MHQHVLIYQFLLEFELLPLLGSALASVGRDGQGMVKGMYRANGMSMGRGRTYATYIEVD